MRKLSINQFFVSGKENGFLYLEKTVMKKKEKCDWKCVSCGKIYNTSLDEMERGRSCECKRKRNKKYSFDEVVEIFKEAGFELLEKEYINANTNMKVRCEKCGYVYEKKIGNIKKKLYGK
jgi:rubredoxin